MVDGCPGARSPSLSDHRIVAVLAQLEQDTRVLDLVALQVDENIGSLEVVDIQDTGTLLAAARIVVESRIQVRDWIDTMVHVRLMAGTLLMVKSLF